MTAPELVARLEQQDLRPKPSGPGKWQALCPAHDDRNPSLSITTGDDGRVLLHCHAGCDLAAVLGSVHLTAADLFHTNGDSNGRAQPLETYFYTDEAGVPLFEVGRFSDKRFFQRRAGATDWKGGIEGVRRVLYRLPEVITSVAAEEMIYVCEGEKDVAALERAGVTATTSPMGAGKWRPEYSEPLAGATITVIADRDKAGRDHALTVARSLREHGCTVTIVEAATGKDAADHLAAGHGIDDFRPAELADEDPERTAQALLFLTPRELRTVTPVEPAWIWHGFIAAGSVTLLSGKPKSGKSTLAFAAADAIASAAPAFLGRAIATTPVVFVSEENSPTIAHKLPGSERVRILTREHAWPKPEWPDLIAAAVDEANRHDAGLIVIDTLPYWAAMAAEREKDAGAAQAVMQPLLDAARSGVAFFVNVHERKGGGGDGEALRGSSAFAGAADLIVELERVSNPRQRALLTLSRYPATPGTLIVDLDPANGAWAVVGEAAERGDARSIVDRQALVAALEKAAGPLKRAELENAVGTPSRQWHKTLEKLQVDGLVVRTGAGKRGDPHCFEMLRTENCASTCAECAETVDQGRFVSSAHPVGVQQKQSSGAATTVSARCAETDAELDADAELARLTAKFPQEELDVAGELAALKARAEGQKGAT